MSTYSIAPRTVQDGPNQAAHLLLTRLIERAGLSRRVFLDLLADRGYPFSDDDFANWGRRGRAFPRAPGTVHAMIHVLIESQPPQHRCSAADALCFLGLTGMPFPELQTIAALFAPDEFGAALAAYLPAAATPLFRERTSDGAGTTASRGFLALAELLRDGEVQRAVGQFRSAFAVVCEQIELLAGYKWLHDLFQQLEDRYYLVYHDYRRLPADQGAWALIERSAPDLQAIVDELIERAAVPSMPAAAVRWQIPLASSAELLRAGVERGDGEALQRAVGQLNHLLGREPSQINTRLMGTAAALRLHALTDALQTVRDTLADRRLGPDASLRFTDFAQGLDALIRLDARLGGAIAIHNAAQQVDDELRRIEAQLEHDATELAIAWASVWPMIGRLCSGTSASWATRLEQSAVQLEAALAAGNTPNTIRLFRACRSQASRGFHQVDRDLLGVCEELRLIGEPLAAVLRMMV